LALHRFFWEVFLAQFILFCAKKKRYTFSTYLFLLIFIAGLGILGKLLIASNVLSIGKLMSLFFITFVPAGILTSVGLSKYKA
jgi:hypothetical protein